MQPFWLGTIPAKTFVLDPDALEPHNLFLQTLEMIFAVHRGTARLFPSGTVFLHMLCLKGHCHAIWQLCKKPKGVFTSIEFQN